MKLPNYLEGHPRFTVYEAFSSGKGGVCLFKDDGGRRCGIARILDVTDECLILEYALYGPYLSAPRHVVFLEYLPVRNRLFRQRRYLLCPGCRGPKTVLAYKKRWACPPCHKLLYRRQLVDQKTLDWERKAELEQFVGKGRPHGMHQRTYGALADELAALRKRLANRRARVASNRHSRLIAAEWGWTPEHAEEVNEHLNPMMPVHTPFEEPIPVPLTDHHPGPLNAQAVGGHTFDFDNLEQDGWYDRA